MQSLLTEHILSWTKNARSVASQPLCITDLCLFKKTHNESQNIRDYSFTLSLDSKI